MDTGLGINNEGLLVYDFDKEDTLSSDNRLVTVAFFFSLEKLKWWPFTILYSLKKASSSIALK